MSVSALDEDAQNAVKARKRLEAATKRKKAAEVELRTARNEWELALLEAQPYFTYDMLAHQSQLSRIRIAQVLREVRARHSIKGP